jgi:hypothetical protein
MDYNLIIAVIVPLAAIGGFFVLARTLLDNWSARSRRTAAATASTAGGTTPGGNNRADQLGRLEQMEPMRQEEDEMRGRMQQQVRSDRPISHARNEYPKRQSQEGDVLR